MTHKILILGTLFEFIDLTRLAKARGYYTIVCDGNADGPARAYADKAYTIDVRQTAQIARVCREEGIDFVITSFSDLLFECMVRICTEAGIPSYVDMRALDLYREKTQTKALCRSLGIGVPRFTLLEQDFTREQIAGFRFPCILKPIDSYGSRGLTVVHSYEETQAAFEEAAKYALHAAGAHQALLEEISPGQELNCMAFVADGKVYILSVADRMTAPLDDVHIPILYALHYPGKDAKKILPMVQDLLQRFVDHTGQKWGPISTQCFYDPATDRIEVCEIAGRMFGFEHRILTLFSGLDVAAMLLDLGYDKDALIRTLKAHDPLGYTHVTGLYINSAAEGILADEQPMRDLCCHPACVDHVLFYKEGEKVGKLGPKPYFARFYLMADTEAALKEAEAHYWRQIRANDSAGRDLLFHPACVSEP